MSNSRIFKSAKFFQETDGEPIRSVVTESPDTVVVAWYLKPNQEVAPHMHPHGQDTWTILQGKGKYYVDQQGTTEPITAGDIVIAPKGFVHGILNDGEESLIFISTVSPASAGYQPVLLGE